MSRAVTQKKPNTPPRTLRALLILPALALAAILLLGAVLLIAPLTETAEAGGVEGSADWMRRLDDETPLNEIVLPGTHNSAARYCRFAFFTKCQALSIREQLEAGYRFLDLRLAVTERGDGFCLTHDAYRCKSGLFGGDYTLDELLKVCYAFLDEHPGETVLLAVRQEASSLSDRECELLMDAYIRENPQYFLDADTIPSLGQARGKLVLLRRWSDAAGLLAESGLPLYWHDQGSNAGSGLDANSEDMGVYTLYVQDRWAYDADDKWDSFLAGQRSASDGAVSLSFLSTKGEFKYGHPYEFAKDLNARLLDHDGALSGWIIVDFGSSKLAERIWRENF